MNDEAGHTPLPISLTPLSSPIARRAVRLLSMVLELHKAGYQRLRICPGHSLDGTEWRCFILPTSHLHSDGWTPISKDNDLLYTTADENHYFGWNDALTDNARSLALKFVERFPETARAATGLDWSYAGWLTQVLGMAENGYLPALFGGRNFELKLPATPLPPAVSDDDCEEYIGTGHRLISHEHLKLEDLPTACADYEQLWPFCLSFDGYRAASLAGADCEAVAERTEREDLKQASMECLRITAFIRQRAIKWGNSWPPDERLLNAIRSVVDEIRRRISE